MPKDTPKLPDSVYPPLELLYGTRRSRDAQKKLCRDLIGKVLDNSQSVYVENGNVYRAEARDDISKKLSVLFVLVPGRFCDAQVATQPLIYIGACTEWIPGTLTSFEGKIRYFCGTRENLTREDLVIPLDTTLSIGRENPAFNAFVDNATLSRQQAKITVTGGDDCYKITIKDGGDDKPSTNGNTVLLPSFTPMADDPRRSMFRTKR